jgi:pimeloyl-ACP methyl ester carboxylesterase
MTRDVVLLPSLGRGASDFDGLAGRLLEAGYRPLALDPPDRVPPGADLHDLAAIAVQQMDEPGLGPVHLVGHAFGNRLARTVTADSPGRVRSLTLLAAGGHVDMEPDVARSLFACFDESLPAGEHLEHVRRAFFAPGNDPVVWRGGWLPAVAAGQRRAVEGTDRAEWWDATAADVLVVQALQDAVAVPENGRRYCRDHPDITTLVEIDGAGHAMLPEQPDAIADALITFLDRLTG